MNAQTKNPGIREAIKELMSVNAGSIFEARFQERLKQKRDKVAREDYVREEGRGEEIFTPYLKMIIPRSAERKR